MTWTQQGGATPSWSERDGPDTSWDKFLDWLLSVGLWDDENYWRDSAVWQDTPFWSEQ